MTYKPPNMLPGDVIFGKWVQWFAWHPVQLKTGEMAWMRKIVRRRVETLGFPRSNYFQYGTIFDVL
jgi:hypothetical protein